VDWLIGSAIRESERERYRAHFAEGRTAVSVFVEDGQRPASVSAIEQFLERYRPVDVHFEEEGIPEPLADVKAGGEQAISERRIESGKESH
jgi:hypothetical protein